MIPYLMASRFFIGPIHFSDSVQQGCDKPEYAAYSLGVQMIGRAISFYILLSPDALPSYFENYNFAIAYLLADIPAILAKNIFAWWLINKKLIKVQVNIWQTFGAPIIASIPLLGINCGLLYLFNLLSKSSLWIMVIVVIIILIFILFGAPIIIFPILGFIGGFDKRGLEHLDAAVELSGPSKFITKFLSKGVSWGYKISPFREFAEKHKIPWKLADQDAQDLINIQLKNF